MNNLSICLLTLLLILLILQALRIRMNRDACDLRTKRVEALAKKLDELADIVGACRLRTDLLADYAGREFFMTDPVPEKVERTPGQPSRLDIRKRKSKS